jgi:hypothetical protein
MFVCFPVKTHKKTEKCKIISVAIQCKKNPEMYAHKKSVAAGTPW